MIWQHTLEDIVGSLIKAGLRIDYLHEFPYCFYDLFFDGEKSCMEQQEDGWWKVAGMENQLPLMFSLKASKGK